MSKTLARSPASSSVSRSNSSVASPFSFSDAATSRFRGLSLLEPLPWAKITRPAASSGTHRSPFRSRPGSASISAASLRGGGSPSVTGGGGGGERRFVRGGEQIDHLLVVELPEVDVELADAKEAVWLLEADHLVELGGEPNLGSRVERPGPRGLPGPRRGLAARGRLRPPFHRWRSRRRRRSTVRPSTGRASRSPR